MPVSASADRVRGVATGLLTAALAVAAHGAGGGALPNGAAMSLLAVLAATAGALATTIPQAGTPRCLLGLLAVSQLLGHLMLSSAGHHHAGPSASPAAAMLAAHLLAIVAGATAHRRWRAAVARAVPCRARGCPYRLRGGREANDCRASAPISRCALHYCLPLRCRTGGRRSASPADRHPNDTRKPNE